MRKDLLFPMAVVVLLAASIYAPGSVHAQPTGSSAEAAPADALVEGTVKKVNPAAKTIDVSTGVPGLWNKRLELTDRTEILDEGRTATLDDIQEGVKVKASYETMAGKNFATRIDLISSGPPMENPEPEEVLRVPR